MLTPWFCLSLFTCSYMIITLAVMIVTGGDTTLQPACLAFILAVWFASLWWRAVYPMSLVFNKCCPWTLLTLLEGVQLLSIPLSSSHTALARSQLLTHSSDALLLSDGPRGVTFLQSPHFYVTCAVLTSLSTSSDVLCCCPWLTLLLPWLECDLFGKRARPVFVSICQNLVPNTA